MISSRETSTKEASSRTELMKELLDLVELTSQPRWSPSPIDGSPPESESESGSLMGSESESEPESSSRAKREDEEKPGGEGPPLIPPP
uniref:ORF3 n=1 Tax=Torque teno Leptonychotes weddellii virus-1 TaxID=2012676 RepID=A0A1Z2RV78_9VIRU|nr:ORF3 [Torque teno Leptonychotes weddellii virus 1]